MQAYPVAGLELPNLRPCPFDYSRNLMPQRQRQRTHDRLARPVMRIRMANPRRLHPHQHIPRTDRGTLTSCSSNGRPGCINRIAFILPGFFDRASLSHKRRRSATKFTGEVQSTSVWRCLMKAEE